MLLSCSQAADTSNPIFRGMQVVPSICLCISSKGNLAFPFFKNGNKLPTSASKYVTFMGIRKARFTVYPYEDGKRYGEFYLYKSLFKMTGCK